MQLSSITELRLSAEMGARMLMLHQKKDHIPIVPKWVQPTAAASHVFERLLASLQSKVNQAALSLSSGKSGFSLGVGTGGFGSGGSRRPADSSVRELKEALDELQAAWNGTPYIALGFTWPQALRDSAAAALAAAREAHAASSAAAAENGVSIHGTTSSSSPAGRFAAVGGTSNGNTNSTGGGGGGMSQGDDDGMGGNSGGGNGPASSAFGGSGGIRWDQLSGLIKSKVGIGASATVAVAASANSANNSEIPSPGASTVRGSSPLAIDMRSGSSSSSSSRYYGAGAVGALLASQGGSGNRAAADEDDDVDIGLSDDSERGTDGEEDDDDEEDEEAVGEGALDPVSSVFPTLPDPGWSPMLALQLRLGGLHVTVEAGSELEALRQRQLQQAQQQEQAQQLRYVNTGAYGSMPVAALTSSTPTTQVTPSTSPFGGQSSSSASYVSGYASGADVIGSGGSTGGLPSSWSSISLHSAPIPNGGSSNANYSSICSTGGFSYAAAGTVGSSGSSHNHSGSTAAGSVLLSLPAGFITTTSSSNNGGSASSGGPGSGAHMTSSPHAFADGYGAFNASGPGSGSGGGGGGGRGTPFLPSHSAAASQPLAGAGSVGPIAPPAAVVHRLAPVADSTLGSMSAGSSSSGDDGGMMSFDVHACDLDGGVASASFQAYHDGMSTSSSGSSSTVSTGRMSWGLQQSPQQAQALQWGAAASAAAPSAAAGVGDFPANSPLNIHSSSGAGSVIGSFRTSIPGSTGSAFVSASGPSASAASSAGTFGRVPAVAVPVPVQSIHYGGGFQPQLQGQTGFGAW